LSERSRPLAIIESRTNLEGLLERLLALFADASIHCTFFTVGEVAAKYPAMVRGIHAAGHEVAAHGYDRGSALVGIGGGATTDHTGFVAAIYLRGVAFALCPTTLLADVDASVGGKTGVDIPAGKNLVGAFYQPRVVVADLGFFDTLPAREIAHVLGDVLRAQGRFHKAGFAGEIEHGRENAAIDTDGATRQGDRSGAALIEVLPQVYQGQIKQAGEAEVE